jgi:hypothetical protein
LWRILLVSVTKFFTRDASSHVDLLLANLATPISLSVCKFKTSVAVLFQVLF